MVVGGRPPVKVDFFERAVISFAVTAAASLPAVWLSIKLYT